MIIECVNGGKLELSKTKLTEVTGYIAEPYFVRLKDLKKSANGKKEFKVHPVRDKRISIPYYFQENGPNTIGCRTFSPATFAKILKAAGVKPVRKTKPVKKARRAKN